MFILASRPTTGVTAPSSALTPVANQPTVRRVDLLFPLQRRAQACDLAEHSRELLTSREIPAVPLVFDYAVLASSVPARAASAPVK